MALATAAAATAQKALIDVLLGECARLFDFTLPHGCLPWSSAIQSYPHPSHCPCPPPWQWATGCYAFQVRGVRLSLMDGQLAVSNAEAVRSADVVVVVSGLDAALPGLLACMVEAPVVSGAAQGAGLCGGR